jgi:N-acetylglucosamine malate deacetylase 1
MLKNFENVLVLAPHTDDGEFGCGGTISKLTAQGVHVTYCAFSSAEESVPAGFKNDVLKKEVREATKILGIAGEDLMLLGFPVRKFPEYRQAILDEMIKIGEAVKPDLVFLPSANDTHQDHQVISQEGFRAFKKISMFGYEVPWNNLTFKTNAFVALKEENLEDKLRALACYKSQQGKSYSSERFIRSWMHMRGTQIDVEYAEAFEVIRYVVTD